MDTDAKIMDVNKRIASLKLNLSVDNPEVLEILLAFEEKTELLKAAVKSAKQTFSRKTEKTIPDEKAIAEAEKQNRDAYKSYLNDNWQQLGILVWNMHAGEHLSKDCESGCTGCVTGCKMQKVVSATLDASMASVAMFQEPYWTPGAINKHLNVGAKSANNFSRGGADFIFEGNSENNHVVIGYDKNIFDSESLEKSWTEFSDAAFKNFNPERQAKLDQGITFLSFRTYALCLKRKDADVEPIIFICVHLKHKSITKFAYAAFVIEQAAKYSDKTECCVFIAGDWNIKADVVQNELEREFPDIVERVVFRCPIDPATRNENQASIDFIIFIRPVNATAPTDRLFFTAPTRIDYFEWDESVNMNGLDQNKITEIYEKQGNHRPLITSVPYKEKEEESPSNVKQKVDLPPINQQASSRNIAPPVGDQHTGQSEHKAGGTVQKKRKPKKKK